MDQSPPEKQRRLRRRTTIKIISEKNRREISQVPLSRGSVLCEEGLRHAEAPGNRCADSAGDQADAELQVQGVCEGDFRLDALLLIELEIVDRTGTFLGSLWESRTNMAIALVEAGIAKYTSFAGGDRIPDAHLLEQAEKNAKKQKLKIWENCVEGEEVPNGLPTDAKQKQVLKVVVTDVLEGGRIVPNLLWRTLLW